jgi:hypothetical protein
LPGLLGAFLKLGVPGELVEATGIAASRVRDAITLMVPLVWLAANDDRAPVAIAADVPRSLVMGDIPLYALDNGSIISKASLTSFNSGPPSSHENPKDPPTRPLTVIQHQSSARPVDIQIDA